MTIGYFQSCLVEFETSHFDVYLQAAVSERSRFARLPLPHGESYSLRHGLGELEQRREVTLQPDYPTWRRSPEGSLRGHLWWLK